MEPALRVTARVAVYRCMLVLRRTRLGLAVVAVSALLLEPRLVVWAAP